MRRTRILGIAPYKGMQTLMEQLASTMDDVELTAFVGDLEPGAAIAQRYTQDDFDVVISRGGTAELIRARTQFPVVEIELNLYDILRSIQLAKSGSKRYAIVGFPAITRNASFLCSVLRYDVELYTIHDEAQARQALEKLAEGNCPMVLCDMLTYSLAHAYGLSSLLIISGSESIEAAIRQAVGIHRIFRPIRERARFLDSALRAQLSNAVAYGEDGEEIYRSAADPLDAETLSRLRAFAQTILEGGNRRFTTSIHGTPCVLLGQQIVSDEKRFAIVSIQKNSASSAMEAFGIRYQNREEAVDGFFNSFYGITHPATAQLYEQYALDDAPLIVAGERGTGKEQMVKVLYAKGRYRNNPLCRINCALLRERGMSFLMNHEASPLAETESTFDFFNIAAMDEESFQQLFLTLRDTRFHRRNKLIFHFSLHDSEAPSQRHQMLLSWFGGITIVLPPLRQHREDIPQLTSLYISTLNMRNAREIIGVEPEAFSLLKAYDWPANYDQFKRILNQLVVSARGPYITVDEVKRMLANERKLFPPKEEALLGKTLRGMTMEEIERMAVRQALAEEHGNQSTTAARLGISRTTLWRILQRIEKETAQESEPDERALSAQKPHAPR